MHTRTNMLLATGAVVAVLAATAPGIAASSAAAAGGPVVSVDSYGAKADGTTINTQAFRAAAAAAAKAASSSGGHSITLLAGSPGVYVTGAFNLSSLVTLEVAAGVTVQGVASNESEHYPIIAPLPSYGVSRDVGYFRHQALIMTDSGAHDVAIRGEGTIDGNGAFWWDLQRRHALQVGRPRLVELYNATNVEVTGVMLKDSGFWTLHPVYCTNVHIHNMTIRAPADSPNTDGVDPDSSTNVLIENMDISVGDDHIAFKSGLDAAGRAFGMPCRNVTVRGNRHGTGHGISIGSEVSGGIEHIRVYDIQAEGPMKHGLHIKTATTRGGFIRDVIFSNITLGDISYTLMDVQTNYEEQGNHAGLAGLRDQQTLTAISDISYLDIRTSGSTAKNYHAGIWQCYREQPCVNMTLENIDAEPAQGWECSNVVGATVKNVQPPGATDCFKHLTMNSSP